ncbi:hypothetical protein V8E36_009207, partial [Tilletia maclaganii]
STNRSRSSLRNASPWTGLPLRMPPTRPRRSRRSAHPSEEDPSLRMSPSLRNVGYHTGFSLRSCSTPVSPLHCAVSTARRTFITAQLSVTNFDPTLRNADSRRGHPLHSVRPSPSENTAQCLASLTSFHCAVPATRSRPPLRNAHSRRGHSLRSVRAVNLIADLPSLCSVVSSFWLSLRNAISGTPAQEAHCAESSTPPPPPPPLVTTAQ